MQRKTDLELINGVKEKTVAIACKNFLIDTLLYALMCIQNTLGD